MDIQRRMAYARSALSLIMRHFKRELWDCANASNKKHELIDEICFLQRTQARSNRMLEVNPKAHLILGIFQPSPFHKVVVQLGAWEKSSK
jgi:hypothetical protein